MTETWRLAVDHVLADNRKHCSIENTTVVMETWFASNCLRAENLKQRSSEKKNKQQKKKKGSGGEARNKACRALLHPQLNQSRSAAPRRV